MKLFDELTRQEQEAYLMLPIVNALKKLGGEASTTEVKKVVINSDENIPETALTKIVTSSKGNTFRPFDFPFNFAVTNLEMAGVLKRPKRGYIVLTHKGLEFNGSGKELSNFVYKLSLPEWEKRKKKNKKSPEAGKITTEEIEAKQNTSEEDENTQKITDAINKLSPAKFELFCRALLTKMNVDIDEDIGVNLSNDGGLDGFGYIVTDDFRTARVAIQAKHWNTNAVSSPEIDKFRGAIDKYRAEYGVFITTSTFTRSAIQAARTGSRVITLIDGDQLTKLVIKYQLYVKPVTIYELDDNFFGSSED
ncbi:MAG: restriction endonuclease [Lactobacillus mulieris]|uniref:Restriction endonuclease n=1 Tax=Lactobacillus mulieris TaxID=2508708 RepID=A0AAP3GWQ4_9LACO|nr:restriction endonuclease [Lactobacillus mulieris]MCF1783904.1 restriction endonuclease [Lactobacillus mulieris]MCT7674439.1 restriction endonuclease [Lactobacillus mulieris]MCT7772564.1 restriction endonuclease [Lactobacillus mulieris]MCW8104672.1 restriction endonuclease [Lactobacillus mulieris]MCZ3844290.1 restriction endonuclease [Lactobacillus mulieris]